MTVVIAYKKHWEALQEQLDLEYDHVFVSPQGADVAYSADRVIIVGNHPKIESKYKGIVPVEKITLDEGE